MTCTAIYRNGGTHGIQTLKTPSKAVEPELPPKPVAPAVNYHITDDNLGVGGAKQKFARNYAAICLLHELERSGAQADPDQQEVLGQYVGWGGLADAFDDTKPEWAFEYAQLKAELTDEEYRAARASTLNAHYTSPTIIRAMYQAIESMGFQTGNILEPAMGVGNFFGMLPEGMKHSRLYGVELDSLSGRIAKQLYPNAHITISGFEQTSEKDFYDLATGYDPLQIGSYRGFEMRATLENFGKDRVLTLTGQLSHRVTLGNDARGNLIRIDNAIKDMPRLLSTSQGQLQNLQEQAELTKAELGKPFPQEAELAQKSQRLAELNSILDMDGKKNTSERGSEDRDDTDRPSVLDDLHRRVEEMPPYRRTESRELEERA